MAEDDAFISTRKPPRPEMITRGDGLRVRMFKTRYTRKGLLRHPFVFQVPPLETFTWQREFSFTEYTTLRKRTFSRPEALGLRSVTFQTLFLDWDAMWTIVHRQGRWRPNPQALVAELDTIMESGTPFRFTVGQGQLWDNSDVNMLATLRSMSVEERAGEVDARYLDLTFTQWKVPQVRRAAKGFDLPYRYDIKRGDTLKSLAKEHYGSYILWKLIFSANRKVLQGIRPDDDLSKAKSGGDNIRTLWLPKPQMGVSQAGAAG